jgi:glycosyltransferase involved in cell wall biosynthesis
MSSSYAATVIISVYKDVEALKAILFGLEHQTIDKYQVIIAEDGEDVDLKNFLIGYVSEKFSLAHMTQEDIGFRKTRAVNRAIASAESENLIFLDGDCIPHPLLIEKHLKYLKRGQYCLGRRMHLGEKNSTVVRRDPAKVMDYFDWLGLVRSALDLHRDHVRNFELGSPSIFLHGFFGRKKLNLVGCNFSICKQDILKVNGYDESLPGIGGEDDDLDRRLVAVGLSGINIKFQAICYHLYHPQRRSLWEENKKISDDNYEKGIFFSLNGVSDHIKKWQANG